MRLANIIDNDVVNGEGLCVSLWTCGCPHKCEGCHNQDLWDYNNGQEYDLEEITQKLEILLNKNGVQRNLSILGGEPLCPENVHEVAAIISYLKAWHPTLKIYLWTGYTLELLQKQKQENQSLKNILDKIDVLIDGPFVLKERDITLPLRGSRNQRILRKGIDF